MIIDTETKRKLREMNASDLLDAFNGSTSERRRP